MISLSIPEADIGDQRSRPVASDAKESLSHKEDDTHHRRCRIHARVFLGALNAVCVVAVGLVALLVTATVSLSQLESNGRQHVTAIGDAAAFRVDRYFMAHENPVRSAAEITHSDAEWDLPAKHPTRLLNEGNRTALGIQKGGVGRTRAEDLWWGLFAETRYDPVGLFLWLFDGSRVASIVIGPFAPLILVETMFQNETTNPIPFTPPLLDRVTQAFDPRTKRFIPHGENPALDHYISVRNAKFPIIDLRYPPLQKTLVPRANHTPGADPVWGDPGYFYHSGDFFYLYSATALFDKSSNHIGYSIVFADVHAIRTELEAVRPTPGSMLFFLDVNMNVFSATGSLPLYNKTALPSRYKPGDRSEYVDPGCAGTHLTAAFAASDEQLLLCVNHASNSPYPVLRKMWADGQLKDGAVSNVETSDGKFYARVRRLPRVKLNGRVVVVVPEQDIIGDVQKTIVIAAVSTAGVVLVAAILAFGAGWAVLHPLLSIALRMEKTARLEHDSSVVSESVFVEISDLQRAFVEMRDELDRIRAFVPQSLLFRTSSCDEDEDDFFDDDASHSEIIRQHDHHQEGYHGHSNGAASSPRVAGGAGGGGVSARSPRARYHPHNTHSPQSHGLSSHLQAHSGGNHHSAAPPGGCSIGSIDSQFAAIRSARAVPSHNASPGSKNLSPALSPKISRAPSPGTSTVGSRSRATSTRNGNTATAAAVGNNARMKLRLASGLRHDHVSILILNLRGFHAAISADGCAADAEISKKMAATVERVLAVSQEERGVVDSFHGDRFMISFNAARPAANHAIRAAVAAARIAKALDDMPGGFALRTSAGIATGAAQIGNVGSASMKRFSIIGAVVQQAAVLERLCKMTPGCRCLVPERLFEDLRVSVELRTVDFVHLPFSKKTNAHSNSEKKNAGCLVADIVEEHSHGADEWMYQLQASVSHTSVTAKTNSIWAMLATGAVADAVAVLSELDESAPTGEGQVGVGMPRLRDAVAAAVAMGELQANELGAFYDDAVIGAGAA